METLQIPDAAVDVTRVAGRVPRSRSWSEEELQWLRTFKEPNVPLPDEDMQFLVETLGRTRSAIRGQLRKMGLQRSYYVNERFFDQWSAPMAWVLGLLHSSGHLRGRSAAATWETSDAEVVQKVRACLDSTHPIYVSHQGECGRRPYYTLFIARQRLRAGIDTHVHVRLHAERSKVPDVPTHLLPHFARGYFEGNGTICFGVESSSGPSVVVSGRTALLADLRERLRSTGVDVPPSLSRRSQIKDTSVMAMSSRRAFRFADFLYRDAPAALSVERKRAVYVRCREWRISRGLEVPHGG